MLSPALSCDAQDARPSTLIQINDTGRQFTRIEGLGCLSLSRDSRANRGKLRRLARRIAQSGSAARDAMEIHRLALVELETLRDSLHSDGLASDADSVLATSLARTIALSQALLDEAATFVWEQTAVSARIRAVQSRLP